MRHCRVIINGKPVEARAGESLIDAALGGSILVPHDCRSGQCQSCRVTVVSGSVDDGGSGRGRTVLACQAAVAGDAEIEFEELPLPEKRAGAVTEINQLSSEIAEVVLTTSAPLEFRPGQYVRVKFSGYPAREFSPTFRLDGSCKEVELVFHIRCLPDGTVSGQLGKAIRPGHKAHVQGPFGRAYLREGQGPLVLIAGGAGWAPIWALARSARSTAAGSPIIFISKPLQHEDL